MQIQYVNGLYRIIRGGYCIAMLLTYDLALEYIRLKQRDEDMQMLRVRKLTVGFKLSRSAWWLGMHYSAYNKRLCINVLPCLTVWVVWPGGNRP